MTSRRQRRLNREIVLFGCSIGAGFAGLQFLFEFLRNDYRDTAYRQTRASEIIQAWDNNLDGMISLDEIGQREIRGEGQIWLVDQLQRALEIQGEENDEPDRLERLLREEELPSSVAIQIGYTFRNIDKNRDTYLSEAEVMKTIRRED